MTFREVQALILGYRAADAATRRHILELIPDLADLVADAPEAPEWGRWRLTAMGAENRVLAELTVVAQEGGLMAHVSEFRAMLPYASCVAIKTERINDKE